MMDRSANGIIECLMPHIGRTVTVFTESGGISGSGFTGVLLTADFGCIRLLASIGAPPACPIGSTCLDSFSPGLGRSGPEGAPFFGNPMGAICVIPTDAIVCFTHNAI
ncbi:MAG: hypothetical protein FWE29_00155 [Defluviitaleaceae bacterium]|nr:hypothetical protein [Defluviitaleaceae bacterium]